MAWTNLTFAFGSLLTSTKITQLSDNITAVPTGAAGAPKVGTNGLGDNTVTPPKLSAQAAGDYQLVTNDIERTTTSATYVLLKEIKVAKLGVYRVKFTLRETSGGVAAYGRIYVNGVAVGTERSASASTQFSEDIGSIASGDLIQVYGKRGASGECGINSFRLYGDIPGDFGINESY